MIKQTATPLHHLPGRLFTLGIVAMLLNAALSIITATITEILTLIIAGLAISIPAVICYILILSYVYAGKPNIFTQHTLNDAIRLTLPYLIMPNIAFFAFISIVIPDAIYIDTYLVVALFSIPIFGAFITNYLFIKLIHHVNQEERADF